MVFKIIWSTRAIKSYLSNIKYLEKEWTEKEVTLLKQFPKTGFSSKQKIYLRKTLIGKHIVLVYRFKPGGNKVELVYFFNSWQNPNKLSRV